jgi:hypothetical protein
MARRGDAGQREAVAGEHVAVAHHDIGHKIAVGAFLHLADRGPCGPAAKVFAPLHAFSAAAAGE